MIGLLLGAAGFLFKWMTARGSDQRDIAIAQLNAAVEEHKAARAERVALLAPWAFTLLTLLIVGPPAIWWMLIWLDTTLAIVDWGIPNAPPPFPEYGFTILLGFLGISGLGNTAIHVARMFRR